MELQEVFQKRRSIRKYQDKPVSTELVRSLINDSTLAPSAGNLQPWKYIIVNNQDMINRIAKESKQSFLERIAADPNDRAKRYEKMLQNEAFHIFYNAPVVVFILGDADSNNLYADCSLAAAYLMLSASNKGLGSCWVNFGTEIHSPDLRNSLGLEPNDKIIAPIALGYPEKVPGIPKRKEANIIRIVE